MRQLNLRQERFVREYVKDGNGGGAYRKVYGPQKHPAAPRTNAWKMLQKPHIRAKISEVRRRMAKRSDITYEKILTDYQEALDIAKEQAKAGEIVAAATAQAKLVGLLRDRVEAGAPGDFTNLDNVSDIIEELAKQCGPEIALAVQKALGLDAAVEAPKPDLEQIEPPTDAVN